MLEPVIVTLLPVLFLALLFGGGALLQRKNIDMDGEPPINKGLFLTSKYAIILVWLGMVLQSWDVSLFSSRVPRQLAWYSIVLWVFGFTLLFVGRFGLGNSFRIGSARENTSLKVNGLYRFSRNPMYVGVYSTLLSSFLYTLNPLILVIGIFIVAVHHRIILAEEGHLRKVFGAEYKDYCVRVRRYL